MKNIKKKKDIFLNMDEIAKKAKVSKMTISRALNYPDKVNINTLKKINKIIDDNNYSINQTANFFKRGVSNNIFCFIPTLKGGNFTDYVSGMIFEAEKYKSKVVLEIYDYSLKQEEEILKSSLSFKPQGLILVGLEHTRNTNRLLQNLKIPIVETWDSSDKPIDKLVGFSHYRLGYDITNKMLRRYKNILWVKSNYSKAKGDYIRGEKKFIGYKDRIKKEKKKVNTININSLDFLTSGKEIINFIRRNPIIDCVICDEICALGAIHEANLLKIKIPNQIAIVGVGNSHTVQLSSPKLTTVDINAYEIGRKAVSQIFNFDNNIVTDTGYNIINGESA